jgi:hypothetical protein
MTFPVKTTFPRSFSCLSLGENSMVGLEREFSSKLLAFENSLFSINSKTFCSTENIKSSLFFR